MANKNVPPERAKIESVKIKRNRLKEAKGMVSTKMYGKIQELKSLGYSKRKTAKELNIDKRTVKKYWEMNDES